MHTLPTAMVQLLAPFAPLFSERVWRHAPVLVVGTILAPGKRTVGAALRSMRLGLLGKGNLMGLAYTAYCSADLCLRDRVP